MRDFVISNSLKAIRKSNPDYDDEKLEIVEYGLEGLYIFITKSIIIFSIAYVLGIMKELLFFIIIYNFIRSVSFGMHATSSTVCLIGSTITFIGTTYLCKMLLIPINIKIIFGLLSIVYIFIYAPADTEKRPIINPKRRLTYKSISTLFAIIIVLCSIIIRNYFISNSCLCALMLQCIMISPVTYKLNGQKYNNYIDYQN